MESLDRLAWAAGISFVSHEAHIGVRVNDLDVQERLPGYLPPGWKPSPDPLVDDLYSLFVGGVETSNGSPIRRYNLVYAGPARLVRTLDLDEALETLETYLQINVALAARNHIFVNAGVVGWCGRAILIVDSTLNGTTELVAALVRAGATYYSDTYAVFDPEGRVHPFAKRLTLRDPASAPRSKRIPVEAIGGRVGTVPLPVGLVAVTGGFRAADSVGLPPRWRPHLLSAAEAVMTLLEHTIPARYAPCVALEALQRAMAESAALTLRGTRTGDAEGVASALLKHPGAASMLPAPRTERTRKEGSR